DADGKEHTLKELLAGHRYLLIDFWASWCGPCRRGIPEVKEFAKKYATDGLAILSISIDEKKDAWEKALKEEQMPWTNLLDEGYVSKSFGVTTIPSLFLIDAEGKVLFEKLYGDAVRRKLTDILGR
ncbi:TlpA disulfide reductase family protein, partial [Odoribacter sp. N15.MGS-14]|uniref:TlpA family protein disulfide reductase n=1 Tax=Odoribacter sp. N15.MGS-14 TaxID=1637502 RepID=UPI0006230AB6